MQAPRILNSICIKLRQAAQDICGAVQSNKEIDQITPIKTCITILKPVIIDSMAASNHKVVWGEANFLRHPQYDGSESPVSIGAVIFKAIDQKSNEEKKYSFVIRNAFEDHRIILTRRDPIKDVREYRRNDSLDVALDAPGYNERVTYFIQYAVAGQLGAVKTTVQTAPLDYVPR